MIDLFIKTDKQKHWIKTFKEKEELFKNKSREIDEQSIFPIENVTSLVELGYPKLTLPESYGGEGLSIYDMVLIQETLASMDGSTGLSVGWHLGVIGEIFESKIWSERQLQYLADHILANGALINRSVSEAQTGSPTRGGKPGTIAIKRNGKWVLSGRKIFTTASPVLTYFLTSAWIEEKQRIGFFLLHKDLNGLRIDETWNVMSMRGTGSHDLVLDEVEVENDALVELPEKPMGGGKANGWMLHIPATYLGIAQAARDYAVHFANHHSPNSLNGPISQLPNVQQHLGEIDLELYQARHVIYSVAEAFEDQNKKHLLANQIGVAKHTVTNASISIVDKAMRVVGAKSLHLSNPLQRYYRDVRAGLHNPPMDDMTIRNLALTAIQEEDKKKS